MKTLHIPSANVKSSFFDIIDDCKKAYFLGLIISDGNVKYGNSIRLELSMKSTDNYILEKLINEISKLKCTELCDDCNILRICSKKLVMELSKYGIVPNKMKNCFLPILQYEFMPHLIRGLLDGNGYISIYKKSIEICGPYRLMNDLREYLTEKLNIRLSKITMLKNSNSVKLHWNKISDVERICNWIYQNKSDLYITRKYEKWLKIQHYFNNRPFRIPAHHIRVRQYDMDGNFVKEYKNNVEAAKETGISKESILANCKKIHKYAGKYIFKFNIEDFSRFTLAKNNIV